MADRYRDVSLWLDGAGDLTSRAALPGDIDADVAIVPTATMIATASIVLRMGSSSLVLRVVIIMIRSGHAQGSAAAPIYLVATMNRRGNRKSIRPSKRAGYARAISAA